MILGVEADPAAVLRNTMLAKLRALFGGEAEADAPAARVGSIEGAAAALMIEAACLDGAFQDSERAVILAALQKRFGLSAEAATEVVDEALAVTGDSVQMYDIIRVIREALAPEERIRVIEMLWEVAYADAELHDYEANLVRRVSGLLYVPDADSGAARKRVLARLDAGGSPTT